MSIADARNGLRAYFKTRRYALANLSACRGLSDFLIAILSGDASLFCSRDCVQGFLRYITLDKQKRESESNKPLTVCHAGETKGVLPSPVSFLLLAANRAVAESLLNAVKNLRHTIRQYDPGANDTRPIGWLNADVTLPVGEPGHVRSKLFIGKSREVKGFHALNNNTVPSIRYAVEVDCAEWIGNRLMDAQEARAVA